MRHGQGLAGAVGGAGRIAVAALTMVRLLMPGGGSARKTGQKPDKPKIGIPASFA